MKMNWRPLQWLTRYMMFFMWALTLGVFTSWQSAEAGVPVTQYQSFAGNINFVATGGTLLNADGCSVNASGGAALSGIPATATITAAYLYWAGSGDGVSPADGFTINLDGAPITADRTFTESINVFGVRNFFSGFKDVTAQVAAKRNGTYTISNFTVDTSGCGFIQMVVKGWGLFVIYQDAAEPNRVINVYDGLQAYQGSSLTLTPGNFRVPSPPLAGSKHGILTWEGDVANSGAQGGFTEDLTFNGTQLTDALNPANNQFNATINVLGSSNTYGVDLDVYSIDGLLSAGDTSATSVYSSGQDVVLLNVEILSVSNDPVADLAISKTHSGNFTVGQNGVYTLSVSNNGPNDETGTITVTDTLPAGLTYVSATGTGWTCGAVAQDVTCTHAGPLANGASLPDITLTVGVAAAAQPSVTNTAMVAGTMFDNQAGNNSSSDLTLVPQPDLSTSTKTVVDLNGGDADPGDTLRYTITLIESGGAAASTISVTDNLPANTTNLSVVSFPAGATNNSTAALVDISNISIPASGSDTIVFDVTVSGSANPGDTIDNTATISNPGGPGASPSAPTVIVSASAIAASGNKPLYLDNVNNLSRIAYTGAATVTIDEGTAANWTLTPALATALTVDGSSGVIPVTLTLGESGPAQIRSYTISLSSSDGAIGTFATLSLVDQDLTPDITATYNLSLTTPGDKVLPAGSTIILTITNDSTGSGNRTVDVTPNGSFVNLPSNTVINVDSVQFYDAAYPGGSTITSTVPGATVYIRSVVSDPFGDFDITSSNLTILDPLGTPVISGDDLAASEVVEVPSDNPATRTYDYAYTIPATATDGTWTAQVIANEGSEGTISHQRNGSILVSSASLTILKSVQTISDPIHGTTNPYNIPGAQMLYTIQVTNSGGGSTDTDTVVVNDTIPANTALRVTDLGGAGSGPVLFINGSPVSGLTYTFTSLGNLTDDLEFSTDGVDWTYAPTADGNGVDTNVRYIRINPKSAMLGNGGGGDPNFQLRFMVVVQ
jgi:uncharacterized repeat protein (TIGR01451 family)